MTNFCRCDNPTITDGKCDVCQMPPREIATQLLHKPPPPLAYPPLPPIPPDPPPWRVCPSCGVENNEHKPKCPRANWNVDKCVPPALKRSYRVMTPSTDISGVMLTDDEVRRNSLVPGWYCQLERTG